MGPSKPEAIVDKMLSNDLFSQWLGIKVIQIGEGSCKLGMVVRKEMLNGFNILHGGVTFSLADSALAFASNTCGKMNVSIEASMNFVEKAKEGDFLTASALKSTTTKKTGVFHIEIRNQDNRIVALFKGTVYNLGKDWEI